MIVHEYFSSALILSFFLVFTIQTPNSLNLMGSMRLSTAGSPDGLMNLSQATTLAASKNVYNRRVMIASNELSSVYTQSRLIWR